MEKEFSFDEVNNFLKKFKEKRGKKTTVISNNNAQKQIISKTKIEENNKKDDNIFGINNNEKNTVDNIFGMKKDDDIFSGNNNVNIFETNKNGDIFSGNNNVSNANNNICETKKNDDIFSNNKTKDEKLDDIFNNTNNNEELFKKPVEKPIIEKKENLILFNNKNNNDIFNKPETPSETLDLFSNNKNNKINDNVEDIFNTKENNKEDFDLFNNTNNKVQNNIQKPKNVVINKKYNTFKAGIVLNNPLENVNKEKENEEVFNIFEGKEDNNNISNNNNIFTKEYNNNYINNNTEINSNENFNEKKEENYIFSNNIYNNENENEKKENNYIFSNDIYNNEKEGEENEANYIFNNDIYNNNNHIENNNCNNTVENPKESYKNNTITFNNNIYYEHQNSNNEVEKLDEDQNNIQANNNEINNLDEQTNKYDDMNDKKEININSNNYNQNINMNLNYRANSEEERNTSDESCDFSSVEKNYVITASNERKTITINNIYSLLNSNSESQLYANYFPISYSKDPDLNKLINLLNIILNNGSEHNEPLSHIISYIFKYILENQLNIEKINLLQNGELKNYILQILSKQIQQENKGTISLGNLFNVETLYNQNDSNLNYNISNEALVHPLEFMLNLFNEKIMNKNNILYLYFLLLNIKENDEFYNHGVGLDEYDYIFDNFECTLFIILKYFGNDVNKIKNVINTLLNSFSSKIKFCHFAILKCLLDDFSINNGKNYGNIFANFLQFPNIEKIIIADIYNFILFTSNASSKFKKVVAKSSILIKYKYSLLKQNNKPENNLLILNEKIYENIHQFGSISKNNYFINHLKEFSLKKLNISTINTIPQQKSSQEENIFSPNKPTLTQPEQIPQQQQGGLFSKFINAFGFGGSESDNPNNNETQNIPQIDRSRMDPSELWKLEHPGEPEIQYDPVLKRYKLRGIIYDDQEEVVKKKEMEKPVVAPPKSKKYEAKKQNINNNINIGNNLGENNNNYNNTEEENIFETKKSGMSGGPGSVNTAINSPFGYAQNKNQKGTRNNQKPNKKNLNQRYAIGYNNNK